MRLISAVSGVQVPAPPPFSPSLIMLNAQLASSTSAAAIQHCPLRQFTRRCLSPVGDVAWRAAGDRVLVALSGGPDSVALTLLLRDSQAEGDLVVAGLAHFNHQLRGADADEDEAFCRALAAALGLPIEVGRADVGRIAREARPIDRRYRARAAVRVSRGAADRLAADAIAVGHTLDDQAETFLLRLLRGRARAGWPRFFRAPGGSSDRSSRSHAPIFEQYLRASEDRVSRGCDQRRRVDSAESRPARAHPLPSSEFSTRQIAVCWRARPRSPVEDEIVCTRKQSIWLGPIVLTTRTGNIELDAVALRSLPRRSRRAWRSTR